MNKYTKFILESQEIHKNKYNYSLVEYVNASTKVEIICPEHGVFSQVAHSHLKGFGCKKCSDLMNGYRQRKTTEQFINEAKVIHNDKYDYSLVNYKTSKDKVTIICRIHGEFLQTPDSHINNKSGCPICCGNVKKITEKYVSDAIMVHGNEYDYSHVNYTNCKTKINIICNKHGMFLQYPNTHLSGSKCPLCANRVRKTTEQFINEAKLVHSDKYDYSLVNYVNNKTKVKIICGKHGLFEQRPVDHILNNHSCPTCNESSGEIIVSKILNELKINYIKQHKFNDCFNPKSKRKLPFDFYIPEYNTCIEYQGVQHYKNIDYFGGQKNLEIRQHLDSIKLNYCNNKKINLILIKYDESYDSIIGKLTNLT